MQTTLLSALVILLNVSLTHGQKGQVHKNQTIKSSVLNQEVHYNIYLPPNYNENKAYPVIYYLHGFGGDHHASKGFMERMDVLTREKKFPETIIIAPDGGISWYMDAYAGDFKTQKMVHPGVLSGLPFASQRQAAYCLLQTKQRS